MNATVVVLRRRDPGRARPFAVPGAIAGVPIPSILGLGAIAVMITQLDVRALALGALILALGLVAGRALRRGAPITPPARSP